ncbi:MAG TPA: argininosuccinate lyase, partial [Cytophagaceae bacterium]
MLDHIIIKDNILKDEKYKYLFSVEAVNELVLEGMPFRDAYKKVGMDIENNAFEMRQGVSHTHEGSIGNLMNEAIVGQMERIINSFGFSTVSAYINQLSE